jgi:hypothetical protein
MNSPSMSGRVSSMKKRKLFIGRNYACAGLPLGLLLFASLAVRAQSIDCAHAVVVSAAQLTTPESSAVELLIDEAAKRTEDRWEHAQEFRSMPQGCTIVVGTDSQIAALLPAEFRPRKAPDHPEAFSIQTFCLHETAIFAVSGHDDRGLLFGVGYLLRKLALSPHHAVATQPIDATEWPATPIRGHQLGYRAKNNTYDAWSLAQFEQYIRDLAIFGANTIQLISPVSDDAATSPLFPAPALETLLGVSRILERYGLDCSIYYPEMEQDYSRPEQVTRELARFNELFSKISRVDSVWIPGGDPGHTSPALLFPVAQKEAEILRRYHPNAKLYISAQGMDAAQYQDFYGLMSQHPAWLTGVFFGPQSRDSFETQRRRVPVEYPLIFYPDIGHAMHAQFPVVHWDPAFALTEGREPINPRPRDQAVIYEHFRSLHAGFITYSEGVNDDVNKFLWTGLGWRHKWPADAAYPAAQPILEDYSRFFVGPRWTRSFAQGLFDLESNWHGPLDGNETIDKTLAELQQIENSPDAPHDNWRLELALYRAYYDAFLHVRKLKEEQQQQRAYRALMSIDPPDQKMKRAEEALTPSDDAAVAALHAQIFNLAESLFHHIGIQLSTKLYSASNWERGANLDRIDIPLNDRIWLLKEFARIRGLTSAQERAAAIQAICSWRSPAPGSFYDDLGSPDHEPHLSPGKGYWSDPELYHAAIDGVADRTPEDGWRWSQLTYAETLYETPLTLDYSSLNPTQRYRLRVTYAGEDYSLPMHLVANRGIEIHTPRQRKSNPENVEFDIPLAATRSGRLHLEWTRPPGLGGSGRGNQVAEVWLIPVSEH